MKRLFLAMVLLCGSSLAAQTSPNPEKIADIRKLISLTGGIKMVDEMFNAMAANFTEPKQQQIFAEFRKEFDPSQILDILAPVYDKYLSAGDVKQVIAFYESPVGRKLLESQPKIIAETMPRILQWSKEVSARLAQKLKEQQGK